jgi:hypothetical protein
MSLDKGAMTKRAAWLAAIIVMLTGYAAPQMSPLTIDTSSLPVGVAGTAYETRFLGEGGQQPYLWSIREGEPPPGLELDEKSGALMGVPAASGEFRFTVALRDSSVPRNAVERKYSLVITAAMTIRWIHPPSVQGEAIRGDMEVSNQTGRPFDLTVIVLAVNEVGKAFALGYQHFVLKPQSTSPPVPFESTLPFGTYVVHADAVAEVKAIGRIYRARVQTDAMSIKQP